MFLVRLRHGLSAFVLGCAFALPLATFASPHVTGGHRETAFRLHFGRTAQGGSDAFRPLVMPLRKQNAQPSPPADLPEFFHNPLRLRRMARSTPTAAAVAGTLDATTGDR